MSTMTATITLLAFMICFVVERSFAGWRLPRSRTWWVRVLLINLVQVAVVQLAGRYWEKWLNGASLLKLGSPDQLGGSPWLMGAIAYFIATFVFYWWHRWRHESDFLWLAFHQIHHSPRRIEVFTSFYKHPLEMVVNSVIGSLLVFSLLGLTLEGAAVYTCLTALGEFFYHTNIRTPRWIGYVFQRPEMHRIHHEYGKHRGNYGDIVWWDMLFGTYSNPAEFKASCGFDRSREERLFEMLAFEDVHRGQAPRP